MVDNVSLIYFKNIAKIMRFNNVLQSLIALNKTEGQSEEIVCIWMLLVACSTSQTSPIVIGKRRHCQHVMSLIEDIVDPFKQSPSTYGLGKVQTIGTYEYLDVRLMHLWPQKPDVN